MQQAQMPGQTASPNVYGMSAGAYQGALSSTQGAMAMNANRTPATAQTAIYQPTFGAPATMANPAAANAAQSTMQVGAGMVNPAQMRATTGQAATYDPATANAIM